MLYGECLLPDNWLTDVFSLEAGGKKAEKEKELEMGDGGVGVGVGVAFQTAEKPRIHLS